MDIKTEGIFLKSIKYSDSANIIRVFTKEHGILAFMARNIHGKKAKIKASYLLPSALFNIEIRVKEDKNMQTLKDLSLNSAYSYTPSNIIKTGVFLMMAESIQLTLIEKIPEKEIFYFYKKCIEDISQTESIPALFPQYFLLNLCKKMGLINAENTHQIFQLNNLEINHGQVATAINNDLILLLLKSSFKELKGISIDKLERKKLMNEILLFYKNEVSDTFHLKTLDIMPLVI